MNDESKLPDRIAGRSPVSANLPPSAPSLMSGYPSTGEIDLVDMGVLLWRRRRVMLAVFLVFLILTIIATVLERPTYEYTTSVQLGSTMLNGNVVPLMSAPTIAKAMQNTYIPQATYQYISQDHVADSAAVRIPKITATGDTGGGSVMLSCKAKESAAAPCVAVETIAAENFIGSNTRFVTGAKNQLASLQAEGKVLQVQLDKLNASAALYQQQETALEQQIARMQKAGIQAARDAGNGSAALSNLILNTEVQRAMDSLASVRQQLEVSIPQQKAQISRQLSDNTHDQELQEQNISQSYTRMLDSGLRSYKPVGLNRWAVLVLGIVLSIILAILAAVITSYVEQIRVRLAYGTRINQ